MQFIKDFLVDITKDMESGQKMVVLNVMTISFVFIVMLLCLTVCGLLVPHSFDAVQHQEQKK